MGNKIGERKNVISTGLLVVALSRCNTLIPYMV